MMPSCKEICENATELSQGKTGLVDRIMFRIHMMICKHCRDFVRQFNAIMGATQKVDSPDAPSDEDIE